MDDPRQLGRRLRREPGDEFRLGKALQLQHFDKRLSPKRRPASQQGIHHAAQAVSIATVRDPSPIGLLGSHVFGRTQHAAIRGHPRVAKQPGNAKVR